MTSRKNPQTEQLVVIMDETSKPMASSLEIAKRFRKQHKDVLRAIEEAKKEVSEDFCRRNFVITSRLIPQPRGGVREEPAYMLTRDGFSYVGMGFIGRSSAQWKEKYIEAFNAMEESLTRGQGKKPPLKLPKATDEGRRKAQLTIIKGLLGFWAFMDGFSSDIATSTMCAALNLASLDNFQNENFIPAWQFIYRAFFMGPTCGKARSEDPEFERQADIVAGGLYKAAEQLRNCRVRGMPQIFYEASWLTLEQVKKVGAYKRLWLV